MRFGPLLPTKKEQIKTVETPRLSGSQVSQISEVGRQGVGCKGSAAGGIPGKRVIRLQGPTTLISWNSYERISRRCVGSWQEGCSSTRTRLQPTYTQWQWLPSRNADFNSSKACPIYQIWHPQTTSSPRWRSSVVTILPVMMTFLEFRDTEKNVLDYLQLASSTLSHELVSQASYSLTSIFWWKTRQT